MASPKYVYLVYDKEGNLDSAWNVKYKSQNWYSRTKDISEFIRYRLPIGGSGEKVECPWEF